MSNSQSKTQETNLIYYQIKKELEEKKKDYQTVTISEYNIDSSSGFDTEEFVRDIFVCAGVNGRGCDRVRLPGSG